jgi:hypothetical protein
MSKITTGDRCGDCSHCRVSGQDHRPAMTYRLENLPLEAHNALARMDMRTATCTLFNDESFHPDRRVLSKCVDQATRK